MDFFILLKMAGGLALFLYGMKTMGEALSKLAGGRLERLLERMTSNSLKAVLLGAVVTAVIQSSSATTVMVIGFVNSGIMKLSQAVGVIMGANIGTTITSWILSLSGIQGDNFFVMLLKPSSFAPVLAMMGIILIMFVKDDRKNDIGTIFIGFAVLMFGMDTMSSAVEPLADVPEFTSMFTAFENPILGMAAGAILTAIVQSSSASVGILQAVCVTGSVSVRSALPIIMGQNIGTCVTALISGLGAGKNAKRASLIHLYFNLIGTVLFMLAFYTINYFVGFPFLSDAATGASIAAIHTVFNVTATLILLPASRMIERLAYITIPKTADEDEDTKVNMLDERFLESPAFAAAQCRNAVCDMAQLVVQAVGFNVLIQEAYNEASIEKVMNLEADIDARQDELSIYLARLAAKPLSETDMKRVNMYGKCVTYLERISDYTKGIAYAQKKLNQKGEKFSKKANAEAQIIFSATQEIVERMAQGFVHEDEDVILTISPLADVIGLLKKEICENHKKRLVKGKCSVELGMALTDMVSSLERIAGHCSNIAKEIIAAETDKFAFHRYARDMREGNRRYKEAVERYRMKYLLTPTI